MAFFILFFLYDIFVFIYASRQYRPHSRTAALFLTKGGIQRMASEKKTFLKKYLNVPLSAALALLCLFVLPFAFAQADVLTGECGANGSNVTWTLDDEGILTISGNGAMLDYYSYNSTVPAWKQASRLVVEDGVTVLGNYAFYGLSGLTEAVLPETLTRIGAYTFWNCSSSLIISLPDDIQNIGFRAFYCYPAAHFGSETSRHLEGFTDPSFPGLAFSAETADGQFQGYRVYGQDETMQTVVIPEGVTRLSTSAFLKYAELTRVKLPESLITIDSNAFTDCTALTEINLPDSVTSIGSYAFDNCDSLTEVHFPEKLTELKEGAFQSSGLTEVVLPAHLSDIGDHAFNLCSNLTSVTLTAPETSYSYSVFSDCYKLTDVQLPEGMTEIPQSMFSYCSKLAQIDLPQSIRSIGKNAFYHCEALETILLPPDIEKIEENAFEYCRKLGGVELPDNVELGHLAFSSTLPQTARINSPVSLALLRTSNCYFRDPECLQIVLSYEMNEENEVIGLSVNKADANVTEVQVPYGVTKIAHSAFRDCKNLSSIILPESLTFIDSYAFMNCEALTEIILPDSVLSLGTQIFGNCRSLSSVALSRSLTEIPENTFWSCESLESIDLPEGIQVLGKCAFSSCNSLTDIRLPESLTDIGEYALYYSKALAAVRIPNGVQRISNNAFHSSYTICIAEPGSSASAALDNAGFSFRAPDLMNLSLRYTVTGDVSSGLKIVRADKETKEVLFPVNVTSIGTGAFEGCKNLTELILPPELKTIEDRAFYSCNNLKSIILPAGLTSIGKNAFYYCNSLTEVTIPEGISEIPAYCFANCSQLKSVSLPDSVTSIGTYAFYYCTNLKSMTLPENVTSVGSRAFYSCWRLTDIYLPQNLTDIADDALWDRMSLDEALAAGLHYTVLCWEFSYAEGWALDHEYPVTLIDGKTPDQYMTVTLQESVLLGVGYQTKPEAFVFPDFNNAAKTWSSSNPDVVSVDQQGRIHALQSGEAEITLTVNGCSAVCSVRSVIPAASLYLPEIVYVPAKGTAVLPLTVSPAEAVTILTYTAEDSSYASVNEEGMLTGRAIGRTHLTVTDEITGQSCSAEVQVTYPVSSVTFLQEKLTLRIGTAEQLEAHVTARSFSFINQLVTFSSSNPEVASVDRNGLVMPLKTGRTTITATASGASGETIEAQCQIVVLPPDDDSVFIELTVTPEEPQAGSPVTLSWDVLGPADNYQVEVSWSLDSRNESVSDTLAPAPEFGSVNLTATARADVRASILVTDEDGTVVGRKQISVQVQESSGVSLSVTPENPQPGEEITVSWEISRPEEHTAGIYGTLFANGMEKQAFSLDEIEDLGSLQYLPEEGSTLQITAWVEIEEDTLEEVKTIPLQTDSAMDPIRISVTYPQTSVQVGQPVSAEYRVSGGSGIYDGNLECHWIRIDAQGREYRLHNRLMTDSEGQWTGYVPEWPGTYVMGMDIMDSRGWSAWDVRDESSVITVTGDPVSSPLGIDFLNPFPADIDLEEGYSFDWDVTGGDGEEWRKTTVHAETDDGVVLESAGEAYGCTNSWLIQAENPADVAGSKYLILELTPEDGNGPGSAVTARIPLFHFDLSRKITLPANLLRIEDEAFSAVDATVFDVPGSVVFIGESAFPRSAGLLVEAGSEAQRWADANDYHYRIK